MRSAKTLVAWAAISTAACVLSQPASAATVAVTPDAEGTGVLSFLAAPGEQNVVSARNTDDGVLVADALAPVRAGNGCVRLDGHRALCTGSYLFEAALGDGDDRMLETPFYAGTSIVHGGAGDDAIAGNSESTIGYGDDGDDTLIIRGNGGNAAYGGAGDDRIDGSSPYSAHGEDGDDVITGGGNLDGGSGDDTLGEPSDDYYSSDSGSRITGGPGNDHLRGTGSDDELEGGPGDDVIVPGGRIDSDAITGGPGADAVSYADRIVPVIATIGGSGGQAGESDRIAADVEQLIGGVAGDVLTGGAGGDLLDGRAGDDLLVGGLGTDVLIGDEGDDGLAGGYGNDSLSGGPGDDSLSGSSGNDAITGGTGTDRAFGNSGADTFLMAGDATRDTVDCGQTGATSPQRDIDRVFFDPAPLDVVAANCEDRHPS